MKKLLIGLLGCWMAACQQRPAPTVANSLSVINPLTVNRQAESNTNSHQTTSTTTSSETTDSAVWQRSLSPAAITALLIRHNLADFWKGKAFEREEPPMDGFFGTDYRRISLAFNELRRDSVRPEIFHVAGKTRFFKTITPFAGEVYIRSVARLLPKQGDFDGRWGLLDVDSLSQVYSATAAFSFREDSTVVGAGRFVGTAQLDFFLDAQRETQLAFAMGNSNNLPTQGTGVLYKGNWTGYRGGPVRPVLLSRDVIVVAPAALVNFSIGERERSFNPKYAKLGWNTYWENDEWWAASPAPKLSL